MNEVHIVDAGRIAFYYLWIGASTHMTLGIAGSVIGAVGNRLRQKPLLPGIAWPWVLTATLWLTGCFFNLFWSLFVYGRLYWSYDYAGWDCSPFGLLLCGSPSAAAPLTFRHGITEWTIRSLWCIYAILCWGSAIWLTRRIMRAATKTGCVEQRPQPYH